MFSRLLTLQITLSLCTALKWERHLAAANFGVHQSTDPSAGSIPRKEISLQYDDRVTKNI